MYGLLIVLSAASKASFAPSLLRFLLTMPLSPGFVEAFSQYQVTNEEEIHKKLQATVIKIIDHRKAHSLKIMEQQWVKDLIHEGVEVSLLTNPFEFEPVPEPSVTKSAAQFALSRNSCSTPEVKGLFGGDMWVTVCEDPHIAEVCISNVRALNEALVQYPGAEMIIIIDSEVTAIENVHFHMGNLIAMFLCSKELILCKYLALSYAPYFGEYEQVIAPQLPPQSRVDLDNNETRMPIIRLPDEPETGEWRYQWKGEGSRALVYRPELARRLVDLAGGSEPFFRIKHDWMEHVLAECLTWRFENKIGPKSGEPDKGPVVRIADPPLFSHDVPSGHFDDFDHLDIPKNELPFIMVNLPNNLGFAARMQTMLFGIGVAAYWKYGVYIVWNKSSSCTNYFEELMEFDPESDLFQVVPFIKILSNRRQSWIDRVAANAVWKVFDISWPNPLSNGIAKLWKSVEKSAKLRRNPNPKIMDEVLPHIKEIITVTQCWSMIRPPVSLEEAAKAYMDKSRLSEKTQIGYHIRRGDLAYRFAKQTANWDNCGKGPNWVDPKWYQADLKFED